MRYGHVHNALDLLVVNQPQRRSHEILVVNPGDELPSVAGLAAKSTFHQTT